ncbi:MAG: GHKL domain-containing protein, partial [Rhodobacteraceae bacterium]|nr:GHKL domain-containing protein [Paracoccaceae bacterium]
TTGQRNPHRLLPKFSRMILSHSRPPFAHNTRLKERHNSATGPINIEVKELSDQEYCILSGNSTNRTGTKLVIKNLRSNWDKAKLDSLKKELERFIIDPKNEFSVFLRSADVADKSGKLVFDGKIKNHLFEKIDNKTISVRSEILNNGAVISTELRQNGVAVLSYKVKNPYSELTNALVQIHYLNPGNKTSFKSITGYTSAEYGSVMLFLNGFRVMPYGEPKDDWLGLNQRKAQGVTRNLGTREVFGRVEIEDSRNVIVPVTSREGVENNEAFKQLSSYDLGKAKRGFIHAAFLALEAYVVNGLDWDRFEPKKGDYSYEETLSALLRSVDIISSRNELFDLKVNEKEIQKIAKSKIDDYEDFVDNLRQRVAGKKVFDLAPAEKKLVTKFVDRLDSELRATQASNIEYRTSVKVEKKRRLFAEAHLKPDSKKNEELIHHMRLLGDKTNFELKEVLEVLRNLANRDETILSLEKRLETVLFNNQKLLKLAKIVSRSDFDLMSDSIPVDMFSYVEQYIAELNSSRSTSGMLIEFKNLANLELTLNLSPIEVSMVIDNIIENARRAKAKKMCVSVSEKDSYFELSFENDGIALSDKYNHEDYFSSGITTTKGSGIGLAQVARIANALEAKVSIENTAEENVLLKFRWPK